MLNLESALAQWPSAWPIVLAGMAGGFALGLATCATWLLARMRNQQRQHELERNDWAREKSWLEERDRLRQDLQQQLGDRFSALSATALERNSEAFLRLAQERFERLQTRSGADLQQRQQAIESLLQPMRDALASTRTQLHEIEKDRRESFGALSQHLQSLALAQAGLQRETTNLVNALRRPEVRGQWGETTLKRLVELAGMVEHCDFSMQESVSADGATLRPDMVVRLPGQREIIVDAKTPLDAYLSALQAENDEQREQQLQRHARQVGQRIRELGAKRYWAQFAHAPEFVVLFIPGEQFLTAALEKNAQLQEQALAQKVILATPNSFVGLLKTVAYGWRQQAIAANAERIQAVGEQLHQRVVKFVSHLVRIGKHLGTSVDSYNAAVGTLEKQILPAARRMQGLGISTDKAFPETEPLVRGLRSPNVDESEGRGSTRGGDDPSSD